MCGIAGLLKLDGRPVDLQEVQRMVACIRHRGPDAEGTWVERNVGLVHTRLSIIDLRPESNQPFHSDDGRYVLVFNGEIFNYVELREELEGLGFRFRTRSDTEVLLQAFIAWGDECVQRFNGMWAFALYDRVTGRLFCSRDRFGIKPFVYAQHDRTFLFGSEIKPMLAVCPGLRQPNYTVLAHGLKQSLSGGLEETCFRGVLRLLPAFNLVVEKGQVRTWRYWDYPAKVNRQLQFADAVEQVRTLLDDAVRIRMRSDVPVGITLSSGLDSNTLAPLMRLHSGEKLYSYTALYRDGESEVDVAAETSARLGMDFQPVECPTDGMLERLTAVVRHLESPHASPSILPLWEIMRVAGQQVRVLMEGQGSDELLAGYLPIYFGYSVLQSLRRGRPGEAWRTLRATWKLTSEHNLLGRHYFFSNLLRTLVPGSHRWIRRFGRGDEGVYIGPFRGVPDYRLPRSRAFDDLLNRRLASAHSVDLVDLLHYGDAISMAFAVESRVPFLDHRLVEAVFAMPADFKLRDGITKYVLREAVRDIVPPSILENRRKQGFTTPVSRWFRERPDETINRVLLSERCLQRGLFEPRRLRKMIAQHVMGERDLGPILFRWLSCELWFREFIDGQDS